MRSRRRRSGIGALTRRYILVIPEAKASFASEITGMPQHGSLRSLALVVLTSVLSCGRSQEAGPADTQKPADSASSTIETHPAQSAQSSPWDDARRRGVDFRAIGQEPGWLLEIDNEKSMYLLADYGEKKITAPAPAPRRDSAGTITYDTTAEGHHLTAVIRTRVCRDAMSGEELTHEVTVTLDGKQYRGC